MRLVLLAVLALAWGGCQTAQAARAQADDRECQGMGYKPLGTEMYLQCRQRMHRGTQAHARQLEADGAGLAPFSRRTGSRIRTRVHATVHRRSNATGRPAATAGSAGRRQEGISRLSSRLAAGTRRAILP